MKVQNLAEHKLEALQQSSMRLGEAMYKAQQDASGAAAEGGAAGVTPAGDAQGFDYHHDTHDVFVLQVSGRKRWVIHPPVTRLPLASMPQAGNHLVPEGAEPLLDVELYAGIRAGEGDQLARQERPEHGRRHAQPDHAARAVVAAADAPLHCQQLALDPLGRGQQVLAGLRGDEALRPAFEQVGLQRPLELRQAAGDRGVVDAERPRGTAQGSRPVHGEKHPKVIPVSG